MKGTAEAEEVSGETVNRTDSLSNGSVFTECDR